MTISTLLPEAQELQSDVVRLRRTIHRHPELGLQLPRTQASVLQALDGLGLRIRKGDRLTSVVATLGGARPGPAILLRADMDALPVHEETGLEFASEVESVMHVTSPQTCQREAARSSVCQCLPGRLPTT